MPRFIVLSNARSGSSYLCNLLRCHEKIGMVGELLNDENQNRNFDTLSYIQEEMLLLTKQYTGFKLFPEQVFELGLRFDDLVRYINAKYVIVLWREGMMETFVSLRLAEKTKIWYTTIESNTIEKIVVHPEDFEVYITAHQKLWQLIGAQWPVDVIPIFVKYEDLLLNKAKVMESILSEMSLEKGDNLFTPNCVRQNPASLPEKVINWNDLPYNIKFATFGVPDIILEAINESLLISKDSLWVVPDREPPPPPNGFLYRVSEPFTCDKIIENVILALYGNSVSSAGHWPSKLSEKLKKVYNLPVAQPCCNGFTSLILALQVALIGEGDEVIMPSLTMIAVANAVKFLKGIPVFVDSESNNYNPGWSEIQSAITENTKAVILTHTYGVPTPDLEVIVNECKLRKLTLIEDISECVGIAFRTSSGIKQLLGTFGDFACASMYANKIIHAGDGGFVLAKNPTLQNKFASLVNHGFTPSYHFLHFENAVNAKINGLGAAIACGCLDKIDEILKNRTDIAQTYRAHLQDIPLKLSPVCGVDDTPWVFSVECESKLQRCHLRAFLAKNGIETRDFFFPLHLQPAFSDLKSSLSFSNSEHYATHGFYLPTHPNLSEQDLSFICDVIKAFFHHNSRQLIPPSKEIKETLLLFPGNLRLESVQFNKNGAVVLSKHRGTNLHKAAKLTFSLDSHLMNERWDKREHLLRSVERCIDTFDKTNVEKIETHFMPYSNYLKSQRNFEQPLLHPWLTINLTSSIYSEVNKLPTTTCLETRQMLCWLVNEMKPRTILELGCFLGHCTLLMAATALQDPTQNIIIYACDAFLWQNWMNNFIQDTLQFGQSFQDTFKQNVKHFKNVIKAVKWPYDIKVLPIHLQNILPDLVFIDFTQESKELELTWKLLYPILTPNKTIIVINGISFSSIPFLTNHADELEPIIQPFKTISKAFVFKSRNNQLMKQRPVIPMQRKLNFQQCPGWSHHHKNSFTSIIETLKSMFHSGDSSTMFIPAVEEYLCENRELRILEPWIGIVHEIPDNLDQFYVPDLRCLCSVQFLDEMKKCKGLFTLTKCQATFLQENWPKELAMIPIQTLTYPFLPLSTPPTKSNVLEIWNKGQTIQLVSIGSFARNFDLFFKINVPINVQKVLLLGNEMANASANNAPADVKLCYRLSEESYEQLLQTSIVFLSLQCDAAANTLILECIARNVPIVSPSWSSCVEYLGEEYPLFYDPHNDPTEFIKLITEENVKNAIQYLERMDKEKYSVDYFINTIKNSAVMLSVSPVHKMSGMEQLKPSSFSQYDVTISICSYKRTHNLPIILKRLWESQDYGGKMEIIVWNNNEARKHEVSKICETYIRNSSLTKCLHLVNSTKNYFAQIRLAMPPFMQSDCLLVCDDDIIPETTYVRFFMDAKKQHENEVLCLRGHKFLPHSLNLTNPTEVWLDYQNLRFVGDYAASQIVHFAHVDACLIPKKILQECASVEMPDPEFALVDDYWMSFILSYTFGRKVRKLSLAGISEVPFQRSEDSDTEGLAMHTRPEVQDAKLRLYVYHMTQGWPSWQAIDDKKLQPQDEAEVARLKMQFWDTTGIGMNISSSLTENDVEDLEKLGIKYVRIGAVGLGNEKNYEFSDFLCDPETQMKELKKVILKLSRSNISVIITLDRRLASPSIWRFVAEQCAPICTVVGYDLINEPYTENEVGIMLSELLSVEDDTSDLINKYKTMIVAIREVDKSTPIVVEPSFWAHIDALYKFNIASADELDPLLIFSIHFYEPRVLVRREQNQGRYQFPGKIPVYDKPIIVNPHWDGVHWNEIVNWNEEKIKSRISAAVKWSAERNIKIFIGEFGISRDVMGADKYLQAVANACKDLGINAVLYSFRDKNWDAMNYELGPSKSIGRQVVPWSQNILMKQICEIILKWNDAV